MALNKLKIHAKKKRMSEEEVFDRVFGKKFCKSFSQKMYYSSQ